MKKVLLALILASAFYSVNAQSNSQDNPYITKSLKDEHFGKIDAETSHGNISVSVVAAAEARIEVYIYSNNGNEQLNKAEIKKLLDEKYTLDISVSGDQLVAIAKQKVNFNDWNRSLSISFKIYTTSHLNTILKTSHGDIDLSGMEGVQDIATSHGNLKIDNVIGKLTGQTSHGDISISGSKDDIDLRTSHGNIETENSEGTISLSTSHGDIHLKGIKGKIHAGTDHGNVEGNRIEGDLYARTSHGDFTLENLTCSVDVSTSQGNISLQLPKGKGTNLDLKGRSVNIDSMENFSGSKNDDSMSGTMNGGGVEVKARTNNGSVSLSFK